MHLAWIERVRQMEQEYRDRLRARFESLVIEVDGHLLFAYEQKQARPQIRVTLERYVAITKYTHHVAWFLAVGKWPEQGAKVMRMCGEPACCLMAHLQMCRPGETQPQTASYLAALAKSRRGLHPMPQQKLTTIQVRVIRHLRQAGHPVSHLAKKYDVCLAAIHHAATGHTFKWVDGPAPSHALRIKDAK